MSDQIAIGTEALLTILTCTCCDGQDGQGVRADDADQISHLWPSKRYDSHADHDNDH